MKKIFIGTVGYHNLRNHSIGTALLTQFPVIMQEKIIADHLPDVNKMFDIVS